MGGKFKSLKGQLLLDGGKLSESYFHRSVVLICQHDPDGALGLILNHSSNTKVSEALVANIPERLKEQTLYLGGPVQPGALSYLVTDEFMPDANVMTNLWVGHSLDELIDLGNSFSASQKIRLFAGYSGWSPSQLDNEMLAGAWLTHPASLDLVFAADPDQLWKAILEPKGWKFKMLTDGPDNLSWN